MHKIKLSDVTGNEGRFRPAFKTVRDRVMALRQTHGQLHLELTEEEVGSDDKFPYRISIIPYCDKVTVGAGKREHVLKWRDGPIS